MSGSATLPDAAQGTVLTFDASRVGTDARDWLALLKPRVISLVVFTGAAGLYMAPGPINRWWRLSVSCAYAWHQVQRAPSTCGMIVILMRS